MAVPEHLATVGVLVNIGAALGVFAYVRRLVNQTQRNSRILLGEPEVDSVGGITEMVYRHEEELDEIWDRFNPSDDHDLRADGSHPPLPPEIQELTQPNPTMTLSGTDIVGIGSWLKDFTYNEAHLFILGFYSGFTAVRPRPRQEPNDAYKRRLNWKHNAWYWKGAYVLGYTLKAILAFGVGLTAI